MSGYYACSRCYERVDLLADNPNAHHQCIDRQPSQSGVALVSDDYRQELRDLLDDPITHDMAEGLGNVAFPQIMHPGGSPTFDFMVASNAEYRSRGGTHGRSMGGVGRALIGLLITRREMEVRERMRAALQESLEA
jgi:hypothetical protein